MSLRGFFLSHPESVGETYAEHAVVAGRFGLSMVGGGIACLVHAVLPGLFPTTASRRIKELHATMSARSSRPAGRETAAPANPWALDFQI